MFATQGNLAIRDCLKTSDRAGSGACIAAASRPHRRLDMYAAPCGKDDARRAGLKSAVFMLASMMWMAGCEARVPEAPAPSARALYRSSRPAGFSGLTFDDRGRLWAVPEREAALVRFELEGERLQIAERVPIEGHPEGYDLESLAFFEGRFFVGTEHLRPERQSDPILVIERNGSKARVVQRFAFPYRAWKILGTRNHGIEGLCVTDRHIVAAAEIGIGTRRRVAPLGVFDRSTGALLKAFRVVLSSETGKISALDCRARGDQIDVLAIERHYGVARLVKVVLDLGSATEELEFTVMSDLTARLSPLPNLEGVARSKSGDIFVITDNQSRSVSGPTMLFHGRSGVGLFSKSGPQ